MNLLYPIVYITDFFLKQVQTYYPEVICRKNTDEKIIALTIDDSPNEYTMEILEILNKYKATATFFVIGNYIDQYDNDNNKIKKIISDGHEIGNHLMKNYPAILLSYKALENDIIQCENKITNVVNMKKYYRPASGIFTTKMIEIVKKLGYKLILGNIYPSDPHIKCPISNSKHILSKIDSGSIIILHDLKHNLKTLEIILPEIINKGYKVVKLSDMIED